MSKVIKVIFTLFNLQGTLPVARGDLNILAHLPPFVKHFFQISCFFVFTQKLRKTNRFLTNFIGLCVHLLPALSSAWIYYHTQFQMSTLFFIFSKYFLKVLQSTFFSDPPLRRPFIRRVGHEAGTASAHFFARTKAGHSRPAL